MTQDLVAQSRDDDFHFYPVHFLMSVFENAEGADAMIAEFRRTGVAAEDVHTWRDAEGSRALDPDGTLHGWLARVWRWAERATGEHAILASYADELQHGRVVIAVRCDPTLVHGFSEKLERHHAHHICYFGAGGIETITRD